MPTVKSSTLVNNGADFLFYPKVAAGESVNGYIKKAVDQRMERDSTAASDPADSPRQ